MLTHEEKKLIAEFNSNVKWLRAKEKKAEWVKASHIMALTGWDKERLRTARESGLIDYKRENGIWYNLSSLNTMFILKTHSA